VGLVEDDAKARAVLVRAISAQADMRLVMQAMNRRQALALLPHEALDVLLVDLGLPDGSGLDVIAAARRQWPDCSVLVSTIFGDEMHVLPSIEAGAMGYLLKDSSDPGLVNEIRSVHAGGSPISPMVARKILARTTVRPAAAPQPPQPPTVALSPREHEVLLRVSKGFTAEETAAALGISHSTVLTFVRRIYAKLEVNSRAEAIIEAKRHGILLQ
jgi:DNA-binding NarL/FixJ family response regulator